MIDIHGFDVFGEGLGLLQDYTGSDSILDETRVPCLYSANFD